jgi:hypothetical protein
MVLRRIFVSKRDEVTREWKKLHIEELRNLCSSPNTIRQIKSRILSWAGHVARMRKELKVCKVSVGKPKERDHSEDRGVDGMMVSEWILGRWSGRDGVWSGLGWFRLRTDRGLL